MTSLTSQASIDTLSINAPQVPVLIDRNDNPLFEMYINSDNNDTLEIWKNEIKELIQKELYAAEEKRRLKR